MQYFINNGNPLFIKFENIVIKHVFINLLIQK